jgi:hypothetical protein
LNFERVTLDGTEGPWTEEIEGEVAGWGDADVGIVENAEATTIAIVRKDQNTNWIKWPTGY